MASTKGNILTRSLSSIFRFFGITSGAEIPDIGKKSPADNLNYGSFTRDEMRHMDGIGNNPRRMGNRATPTEDTIQTYLESVSDNTHTKIEELKNLTLVAPEIKVSKRVIVSTIMSPQDLQTNSLNITMGYEGITEDVKNQILEKLNNHFNKEYNLPSKMAEWLSAAGFEEGAKAIIVLPKHELDVQNAVADVLAANEDLRVAHDHILASTEDLFIPPPERNARRSYTDRQRLDYEKMDLQLEAEITQALEDLNAKDFFEKHPKGFTEGGTEGNEVKIKNSEDLAKQLKAGTLKLLRHNGDGTIVVTRDLSQISKGAKNNSNVMNQLLQEAKAQLTGFDPKDRNVGLMQRIRCYSISDTIRLGENDLPIVLELPADSVIPVCAPRDNKNHIGYFVLLDEQGQPLSGKNNYFKTGSTDVTNRLAMSAAKGVYGNATLTSFSELTSNPEFMLNQMSDVFAVAVNKLLDSKLGDQGLTGLHVNVHNAVGKAMFLNLLARNRIKMVFVPEPMMVYYRFDHREDGTGKTFLEDVSQMLALRTTLMVARLMAAIDNATQHRNIEVDVDEKDNNPLQTLQMVVRQALSKYAPSFSTEVQTAAESMINRNITVKPKSVAGTTDNLSVTYDKSYGNSQAPDSDLMDKLNNWIGMGLGGLPASVLNQLSENEFSRSVATTNMYFANQIAQWQKCIKPHNKKFIVNYVSSNTHLIKVIRDILGKDKQGEPDQIEKNQSSDVKDTKLENQIKEVIQSLDVDLPPPAMAVKKAHFEEIQAFADMLDKIIALIYSDDIVVDDELKSNMNVIRASIVSKLLREFLPKLGVQAIATIPEPSGIDADYAKNIFLYLTNLRRKIKNLSDATKGQLRQSSEDQGAEGETSEEEPTETTSENGEEEPNFEG